MGARSLRGNAGLCQAFGANSSDSFPASPSPLRVRTGGLAGGLVRGDKRSRLHLLGFVEAALRAPDALINDLRGAR
jgi:hypothetical protein